MTPPADQTPPPLAFVPPDPLPYEPDDDDKLLPSAGFITDFVEAMRGVETPSMFSVWGALWALSTCSVRLAYIEWMPEAPLFPNIYVIIVAPPGRCRKSTTLSFTKNLLSKLHEKFDQGTAKDGFLRYMSQFNWATSKTTPDALYEMLKPQETTITGSDKVVQVKRGSQLTISVSELATFLNKKKFNVGLVETLTDLYDCSPYDTINTLARGTQELKDVFVTFIGATTPTGMKDSLPHETFGEGFVSRVVVVYKEKTTRRFPNPVFFDGFLTLDDLRERLAWIMRHKLGEYTTTAEAQDWYEKWYEGWRDDLDADERFSERAAEFRFDVNLLRIAMLISMSRYTYEKVITKQDMMDAHRLLKGTYKSTVKANVEAGIAPNEYSEYYGRVVEFFKRHRSVERAKLVSNMSSKGIKMADVKECLAQLLTEGRIMAYDSSGSTLDEIKWKSGERYAWADGSEIASRLRMEG